MPKRILFQLLLVCLFLFIFNVQINAQKGETAKKVAKVTAKTGIVIVGKSAKYTYQATKFTAKNIAKPIIIRSAPKVGEFMLSQTGNVVKSSYPVGKKLFIKYIKYKFIP